MRDYTHYSYVADKLQAFEHFQFLYCETIRKLLLNITNLVFAFLDAMWDHTHCNYTVDFCNILAVY